MIASQPALPRRSPRRAPQRGQATTEFVVIALVLVPLFIAVPLVGKYIDLMQATESASRYVAFEATVRNSSSSWKPDAELATEVRRRFFSNSDAPVKTNEVAGDFTAHRNPVWSDRTGKAFIEKFQDGVGVATGVANKNAIAATVPFRSALGLSDDNLFTARVTSTPLKLADFKPFDTADMKTTRTTVILADAWTARNPTSIRDKIEGSALIYPLGAAKPIVDFIGMLPATVFDPPLVVGNFDWDIVPCDRLIGGC